MPPSSGSAESPPRSLLTQLILSLAAIASIAAAITGSVTGVTVGGLAKVRDAREGIGSGSGDLTRRLPVTGNDEVAQIARSFKAFVGKINSVMVQIRDTSEAVRHAANEGEGRFLADC